MYFLCFTKILLNTVIHIRLLLLYRLLYFPSTKSPSWGFMSYYPLVKDEGQRIKPKLTLVKCT